MTSRILKLTLALLMALPLNGFAAQSSFEVTGDSGAAILKSPEPGKRVESVIIKPVLESMDVDIEAVDAVLNSMNWMAIDDLAAWAEYWFYRELLLSMELENVVADTLNTGCYKDSRICGIVGQGALMIPVPALTYWAVRSSWKTRNNTYSPNHRTRAGEPKHGRQVGLTKYAPRGMRFLFQTRVTPKFGGEAIKRRVEALKNGKIWMQESFPGELESALAEDQPRQKSLVRRMKTYINAVDAAGGVESVALPAETAAPAAPVDGVVADGAPVAETVAVAEDGAAPVAEDGAAASEATADEARTRAQAAEGERVAKLDNVSRPQEIKKLGEITHQERYAAAKEFLARAEANVELMDKKNSPEVRVKSTSEAVSKVRAQYETHAPAVKGHPGLRKAGLRTTDWLLRRPITFIGLLFEIPAKAAVGAAVPMALIGSLAQDGYVLYRFINDDERDQFREEVIYNLRELENQLGISE